MNRTTLYYAPEAIGSNADYFFDGVYMYQRVHGLGSLGALHGWLKKIGRKIKKVHKKARRAVKKIHKKAWKGVKKLHKKAVKFHKKIGKKVWKGVKKVGKKALKVIHKALPIVSTVLAFVPGVGWAASAALMAAQVGLDAWEKGQKKKARKRKAKKMLQAQMKAFNAKTTRLAKPAKPVTQVNPATTVKRVNKVALSQNASNRVRQVSRRKPPMVYTLNDFMKINQALQSQQVKPEDVAALMQQINRERLQRVLNY